MGIVHPFLEAVIHLGWGPYVCHQNKTIAEIIAWIDFKIAELSSKYEERNQRIVEGLPESIPNAGFKAVGEDNFIFIKPDRSDIPFVNKEIFILRGNVGHASPPFGLSGGFFVRPRIHFRGDMVAMANDLIPEACIVQVSNRMSRGEIVCLDEVLQIEGINHITGRLPIIRLERQNNALRLVFSRSWEPWKTMRSRLTEHFGVCESSIAHHSQEILKSIN